MKLARALKLSVLALFVTSGGFTKTNCASQPVETPGQTCWQNYKKSHPDATHDNSPEAWNSCYDSPVLGTGELK